jgi:hypothetical protein
VVEETVAVGVALAGVALAGDVEAGVVVEGAEPVGPGVLPQAPTASEMVMMAAVISRKRWMVHMGCLPRSSNSPGLLAKL